MSGWTLKTLKRHQDARLRDFKSHVRGMFREHAKAIKEFKSTTQASFASRNEIQTAMKNAAEASERATAKLTATFLTRNEALGWLVAAVALATFIATFIHK